MDKLTKKEFKELHSNNKLLLVQACYKHNKEEVKEALNNYKGDIKGIKTSKVDIDNYKDIITREVYKDKDFIYLEEVHNASKDNNCSWNDITYNTILYKTA